MLFRLAFANVWRRLSRSMLTLLAMAMAAAVLTAGLSLSQGTTRMAYLEYRQYYGADILVMTPGFVGAAPVDPSSEVPIAERVLHDSGFNQLIKFYPDFAQSGYLAEEPWRYAPLSADLIALIGSHAMVSSVSPYLSIPAFIGQVRFDLKPLSEGWRDVAVALDESLLGNKFPLMFNAYPTIRPEIGLGQSIDLALPHIAIDRDGLPYVDYSLPFTSYQTTVVGRLAWPTRVLTWSPEGAGEIQSEQGYVHAREIYLPYEVWESLWRQQTGAAFPVTSLRLTVRDMSQVNVIAAQLQAAYPDLAVIAVPTLARHVERYGLLDRFYWAPAELWASDTSGINPYTPLEFGAITAVLLYLNAGMLLASQMLAAISSRRKEIGILKAIGGRNREVVGMILLEAMILAIIGASAGFALIRLAGIHQAATNRLGLWFIIMSTLREALVVVGLTGGISLIFGALPAWRVARLTVMDVFRNE
ncbi:MAG TPA: ABC transporter permease [Bacillota bacterium]|nr:ABC transporter permease [Bacillota bacterium]